MSTTKKFWHDQIGYNYRLTNLQAAIGLGQLENIEKAKLFGEPYQKARREDGLVMKKKLFLDKLWLMIIC